MDEDFDLTAGWYFRVYGGFVKGQRLCGVSLKAEAWFWRLHTSVDHFGNAEADPQLMWAATRGRRLTVTVDDVVTWYDELKQAKLIGEYVVKGEPYFHIFGFAARQPRGRNGKAIRRFPPSPWDESGNPGESRLIQIDPGDSVSENENESVNKRKRKNDDDEQERDSDAAAVAALLAQEGFDQDDELHRHVNATLEQVRVAIENADAKGAKLGNRKGYIAAAIRGRYPRSRQAARKAQGAARAAKAKAELDENARSKAFDELAIEYAATLDATAFNSRLQEFLKANPDKDWIKHNPTPQNVVLARWIYQQLHKPSAA